MTKHYFKDGYASYRATAVSAEKKRAETTILAIGDSSPSRDEPGLSTQQTALVFAPMGGLTFAVLSDVDPDVVVCTMVSRTFDCLDLAEFLHSADFHGQFRIVVPNISAPAMLLSEIRHQCPGLDVDLLMLDAMPGAVLH